MENYVKTMTTVFDSTFLIKPHFLIYLQAKQMSYTQIIRIVLQHKSDKKDCVFRSYFQANGKNIN